jgi:sialidase-1
MNPPTVLEQAPLFVGGDGGYRTYRIPALAVSSDGTLLAFCEGRRDGLADHGRIDLLLRRSFDHGKTWEPARVVVDGAGHTAGNPAPVVERASGAIALAFCRNAVDAKEEFITAGQAARTVWVTRSADDGATWETPREITADVKRPGWTWYATGPGHGIQLRGGRLLIPCDHIPAPSTILAAPARSHAILSDDGGATWRVGGIAPEKTNECAAVELADGSVYLNSRHYAGTNRRAVARSRDGGESFGEFGADDALVEPVCQDSLVGLADTGPGRGDWALFANPASTTRHRMTVRLSRDGCRTWERSLLLNEGRSGYSDLCVARDGTVCCLYERGEASTYETLTLARFPLGAILEDAPP